MALFHYPNQLLESGEKGFWLTPILEVAVTTLQPALFALGTAYWPVKARFGRAERAEVLRFFVASSQFFCRAWGGVQAISGFGWVLGSEVDAAFPSRARFPHSHTVVGF